MRESPRRLSWFLIAGLLAATDLVLKAVVESQLTQGEAINLGLLNIRLLYNPGVSFGLGAELPDWIILAVTGAIITAIGWYVWRRARHAGTWTTLGPIMALGGATANFIDRLDGQGVVDYFHTSWFPTFNLADVFVVTGAILTATGSMLASTQSNYAAK